MIIVIALLIAALSSLVIIFSVDYKIKNRVVYIATILMCASIWVAVILAAYKILT